MVMHGDRAHNAAQEVSRCRCDGPMNNIKLTGCRQMSDDILASVFNLTGMTSKSSRKGFLPSTSNLRFLENRRETVCVSVAVSVWRSDERLEVLERISVHGIALKAPQKNLLYSLKIHTTQPLRGMFSKILQKTAFSPRTALQGWILKNRWILVVKRCS